MTQVPSADIQKIALVTEKEQMFTPCMVGQLEAQLLKMMVQLSNAKRVLDVGTFTGMSAMAFAEGVPENGEVVTIEFDSKIASVADQLFRSSSQVHKLTLKVNWSTDEVVNKVEPPVSANQKQFAKILVKMSSFTRLGPSLQYRPLRGRTTAKISVNRSRHVGFARCSGAGERGGEGAGERGVERECAKARYFLSPLPPPPLPFTLIPSPLIALSTLSNLPLLLKSKIAAMAFARPNNTPALQAKWDHRSSQSSTQALPANST